MAVTKEEVVEFISSMTVLELSEFIKELEEKFGVSAAAPAAAAGLHRAASRIRTAVAAIQRRRLRRISGLRRNVIRCPPSDSRARGRF